MKQKYFIQFFTLLFVCISINAFAQREVTLGAVQTFNATTTSFARVDQIDDTHVLYVYKNGSIASASDIYAVIGEVNTATSTVTFGTPTLIEANDNRYASVTLLSSTVAIVSYENDSASGTASDTGYSRVLTLNTATKSITVGNAVDVGDGIDAAGGHNPISMIKLTSSTFALLYTNDGNISGGSVTDNGTIKIGTVSGSGVSATITYGSGQEFETADASNLWGSALSEDKIVISYSEDGAVADEGTVIVGTVSGNTVTFGTPVLFNTGGTATSHTAVQAISDSQFVVAYTDDDASDYAYAKVGTVSGTSITLSSSAYTLENGQDVRDITIDNLADDDFVVGFNGGSGDNSKVRLGKITGTGTSASIAFNTADNILTSLEADDSYVTKLDANSFVVAYIDDQSADEGESLVGTKDDINLLGTGGNTFWSNTANWTGGSLPTTLDNVIIPNTVLKPYIGSSIGAVANNITIDASASLTIESGGSLIIEGTATVNGDFTYQVAVTDDKWHLISSPVSGEQYDDTWNNANGIDTGGTGNNEAVASYINTSDSDGDWVYYQDGGSATTFGAGVGYSLKYNSITGGSYTFTGTFPAPPINTTITANDIMGVNENRWTLVGNPFPAHIDIATFLSVNATPLTDSHESVYVWNAATSTYDDLTTGYIHPGQGFFVNSNVASTSVSFTKAMQSDQNGVTFYRNANQQIILNVTDGSKTKSTEINYIANKTTGLDPRFDIGTFTGQASNFNIFTHLVNNSEGVNFKRQALPNSNYESMIIPVGINAANGNEITFTAEALNLPTGIKVFLEDRDSNTFTRLDEDNSEYKITLTQDVNGIGRFYLQTSANVLSVSDTDVTLENVSIYKTDNSNIRIVGLQNNNLTVKIFNILGKQILQKSLKSNGVADISIPNLASGVYLIQLQTEKGKLNKKIILE